MKAHLLPAAWTQRAIRVHLVGVGGTGSQVLTGLARLHRALLSLGHPEGLRVTAWDPDHVTLSNLGRQLFAPGDVGASKAAVLVHRVNCYFGLDWRASCQRFEATPDAASQTDLLITCVDTAAARRTIAAPFRGTAAYWLDCGNARQSGQVFLAQFGESPGWGSLPPLRHWLPEVFDAALPEDDAPSCSLAEALESQDLFVNQMVATWALHLLWSFVREGGLDVCGYWISLESGIVAPVPVPALDASPEAGARPCGGMQG